MSHRWLDAELDRLRDGVIEDEVRILACEQELHNVKADLTAAEDAIDGLEARLRDLEGRFERHRHRFIHAGDETSRPRDDWDG